MLVIKNVSNRLVTVRLNSGDSLILDPGRTSAEMVEQELKGNAKIDKLISMGVIAIEESTEKETSPEKNHEKSEDFSS